MPFDYMYPNTAASYTASTSGQPLGDLNWFGLDIIVDVDSKYDKSLAPSDYALENNYPNPFNPTTRISYAIPIKEMVSLKIYNMLGQEVRTLINLPQNPGRYTVEWDGRTNNGEFTASGVYIYSIRSGSYVESKKMILLK
jgi:flagellar hook assembly protein FlgD